VNLAPAVDDAPLPSPAVSVRVRATWMLLALLPGVVAEALAIGTGFALLVAGTLSALFLADRIMMRTTGTIWHPQALLMPAIVLCWLPLSLPWWLTVLAATVAWACARSLGRITGGSPFHPAMIGSSLVLCIAGNHPAVPPGDTQSLWIALAFATAGIALAIGRCIRWQVALATWLGGTAMSLTWLASGWQPPAHELLHAALPAMQLTVFFVATDPSSGCQSARARWVFGFGVGVLARLALLGLHDGSSAFLGLAGAVLVMNAAAPRLDRMLPSTGRHRTSTP